MTKNQIWVVIIVLVVGLFALLSDVEVKIQVGSNETEEAQEYATRDLCILREMQKCNDITACGGFAIKYCDSLGYPIVNPFEGYATPVNPSEDCDVNQFGDTPANCKDDK